MILFMFSLIMELFLPRNVGIYRSFLQFYDEQLELLCIRTTAFCCHSRHYFDTIIDANYKAINKMSLFPFQTGLYSPLWWVFWYKNSLRPLERDFSSTSLNGGILLIQWSSPSSCCLLFYGYQHTFTLGMNGSQKKMHSSLQMSSFQAP